MSLGNVAINISIKGAYEGQQAVKQAKADIDKLTKGTKGMTVKVTGMREAFNKTWTETSAKLSVVKQAFSAAAGAASGLFELAKEGAAFTDQMAALQRMGVNVEERLREAGEATKGTLADKDLLEALSRFKGFGLDMDKFSESLELASKASIMTGRSVDFMVDKLVTGLVRQSPKLLDDLMVKGVQVSDVNERAAKMYNKSKNALTDADKAAALHVMTLEKLRKITAGVSIANDSQAASFKRVETAAANFLTTFSQGLASMIANALEQWEYALRTVGADDSAPMSFDERQARIFEASPGADRDAAIAAVLADLQKEHMDALEGSTIGQYMDKFVHVLMQGAGVSLEEQALGLAREDLNGILQAVENHNTKLAENIKKAQDASAARRAMPGGVVVSPSEDDPTAPTTGKKGPKSMSAEMLGHMAERLRLTRALQDAEQGRAIVLKKLIAINEVRMSIQEVEEKALKGEIESIDALMKQAELRLGIKDAEIAAEKEWQAFKEKGREDDRAWAEEHLAIMRGQLGEAQNALDGFASFAMSFGDSNADAMGRVVGALGSAAIGVADLGLKMDGMAKAGKSFSGEMGAATAQGIAQIGKLGAAAAEDKKTQAAINAAFYAAAAVVAFTSQNYIQGAGFLLASGMYAAVAGTTSSAAGYAGQKAGIDRSRPIVTDERGSAGATVVNINAPIVGGSGQEIGAALLRYSSQGESSGMGGEV